MAAIQYPIGKVGMGVFNNVANLFLQCLILDYPLVLYLPFQDGVGEIGRFGAYTDVNEQEDVGESGGSAVSIEGRIG